MNNLDTSLAAILITILLAIIGFAFGYGILTNKVSTQAREIKEMKDSYKLIDAKLDTIANKLSAVETVLRMNDKSRG